MKLQDIINGILVITLMLFANYGCSKKEKNSPNPALEKTVEKIESGETVKKIEEFQVGLPNVDYMKLYEKQRIDDLLNDKENHKIAKPKNDPCPDLKELEIDTLSAKEKAIELAACFGGLYAQKITPLTRIRAAMVRFVLPKGIDLANKSLEENINIIHTDLMFSRPRGKFTNEELETIKKINQLLIEEYKTLWGNIFYAMELHKELFEGVKDIYRFHIMLKIRELAVEIIDNTYILKQLSIKEFDSILKKFKAESDEQIKSVLMYDFFDLPLLAITSLIPKSPYELPGVDLIFDVFQFIVTEKALLNRHPDEINTIIDLYKILRDQEPKLPKTDISYNPTPSAAKVVFIDDGFDYLAIPEAIPFIGLGKNGRVVSYDFADSDPVFWSKITGPTNPTQSGHGTSTAGAFLSTISHFDKNILLNQQLDLGIWKLSSIRQHLGIRRYYSHNDGSFISKTMWQSWREAFRRAILYNNNVAATPDIVSISLIIAGPYDPIFLEALKSKPWLWVMSAGNNSHEAKNIPGSCFNYVPNEYKFTEKLICVGALTKGIVEDKIANYSNYGDGVDLYAYESMHKICPNGTSCAVPTVTAAATMLKARYSYLVPSEIKEILVKVSEEKELQIDGSDKRMRVRVFNIRTHMDRAFKLAEEVANTREVF